MEPKDTGYTLLLVPDSGEGEIKQISMKKKTLRRWAIGLSVGLGFFLSAFVVLLFNVGRILEHDDLESENLTLRKELGEMDYQVQQAEELLGRFRVYDAQLRDLISLEVLPGFGPVSKEDMEAMGLEEKLPSEAIPGASGEPMDDVNTDELSPVDIRPVGVWASEVQGRLDLILRLMEQAEPRVAVVAEELEDLSALRIAFPQIWPVKGKFTSGFGYRTSPIYKTRKLHRGIDIAAARGTPVYAVAPGVVISSRYNSGYGNIVVIDHGFGIKTRYAHNSSLLVREGQYVEVAELIATVGSTGQSTGPHCHFELHIDDQAVDPLDYLPR